MSVKSMTGHGRGESAFEDSKVIVELNSVNHRQFDLRIDLPPLLSDLDEKLRGSIHAAVARGAVTCRCHFMPGASVGANRLAVDYPLAMECMEAARRLSSRCRVKEDFGINSLFAVPGVIRVVPEKAARPGLKEACLAACSRALRSLSSMRAREGKHLARDIARRVSRLEAILEAVARRSPEARQRHKQKISALLRDAAGGRIDGRILRDILSLAERGEISEEISRSRSHILQLRALLAKSGPAGRTMEFLVQEMMREINTAGSKSSDCFISKQVVEYKAELENIREQVQNIE